MARLRDFLPAVRSVGPFQFAKNIWREIGEDNLFTLAAALAYSWLFAVFPFLIFLVSLIPYIPEGQKAHAWDRISHVVNANLAREGARTMLDSLHQVIDQPRTGLLSIGLVVTLWAASGGMAMTMSALDATYDAPKVRPFYKQRPLAILLTVVITAMILLVFILLPIMGTVIDWMGTHGMILRPMAIALDISRYGFAIMLLFFVLGILYKFGTVVRTRFSFISPGAVFTVTVWILLGSLFRFYIDKFGKYEKTYGTMGGVVIILFFFYLDALVLLIGGEINAEVDCTAGSLRTPGIPVFSSTDEPAPDGR